MPKIKNKKRREPRPSDDFSTKDKILTCFFMAFMFIIALVCLVFYQLG